MSGAPKAVQARYADWRPVKGRKVLQLVLEVPLEQQGDVLNMLGAPNPVFAFWLMGFPAEWISGALAAMRSYRKLRQRS